jgi:uncharacterized membrane protein
MRGLQDHLQTKLLAGTLAAIPVAITGFILWYVDAKIRELFTVQIPGLGIPVALGIIYLMGVFVTSLLGQYFLRTLDWALERLPGFRDLYRTWKQIAVTPDVDAGVFAKVVLLSEGPGMPRVMGFTSGRPVEGSEDLLCVFVPLSPNPTSGRLYLARSQDVEVMPVTTKDALKFVVSGGNFVPSGFAPPRRP